MPLDWLARAALSALSTLAASPAFADDSTKTARKAIEQGLIFLEKDAAAWRKDRQCATCHHGTMTVWAMSEAKSRGFVV